MYFKEIKFISIAESSKLCEAIPFKKLNLYPTMNDPEVLISEIINLTHEASNLGGKSVILSSDPFRSNFFVLFIHENVHFRMIILNYKLLILSSICIHSKRASHIGLYYKVVLFFEY